MSKVAILGAGKMGSAMARELVNAGIEIAVWNRTRATTDALVADIASPLASVSDTITKALSDADIAICTFSDGKVTQSVLLSDPGTLAGVKKNLIIVDMGTSGVEAAKILDQAITKAGLRFVDAPISGSVTTVAGHQLLVMASGSPDGIDEIGPVFRAFAKKVVYLGTAGAGQAMKLSVNLVVHALDAAVSEALAIASKSGISPEAAYDVLEESVVAAPFVKYKRTAFLDRNTPVAMRVDTVLKDMSLINSLASGLGLKLRAAPAVENAFSEAVEAGLGCKDMARLIEIFLR